MTRLGNIISARLKDCQDGTCLQYIFLGLAASLFLGEEALKLCHDFEDSCYFFSSGNTFWKLDLNHKTVGLTEHE